MRLNKNNKQTAIAILVTVGVVVALFGGCRQRPAQQSGRPATSESKSTVTTSAPVWKPEQTAGKSVTATAGNKCIQLGVGVTTLLPQPALQPGKLTAYLGSPSKGIIGLYDGNQTDNPADNIFNIKLDYQPTVNDKVWLTYRLTGVADNSGVACSINDRLAFGGYLVKKDTATKRQRVQLNAMWLQKGENRIQFGLAENAGYGYRISDLALEVEQGTNDMPLAVTTSRTLYNGKAYVHGFVQATGKTTVSIDGKAVAVRDGEFETIISPADKQQAEVTAELNGRVYTKTLRFGNNVQADAVYALGESPARINKTFEKGKTNELKTPDVLLKTDDKSLLATKNISLTALRPIDLPAMDLGMTNVTADKKGFRFLPHGEHFTQTGATVALKYDRTKIPDGYTENDIRSYYFDPNTKHWVALERDTVDKALCMVVSKTTHFTDMINGVIKTPESPETQGFAPTMMNDIKAADPTSKIEMIAPPTANNQGSANLSYPLELPPARNGMSPQLAIQYNSDGGSGWLGEGWDLNVPSITVDTKFGVPTYSSVFESETYSIGGVMLARAFIKSETDNEDEKMFFPDRGVVYKRNIDENNKVYQFYPRIEGNFQLIERIGNHPYDYKWRVTDKSGTKYYYGYNGAVLAKDTIEKANIAEWKLQSMVDIHGDSVAYSYTIDRNENSIGTLKSSAIYLNKIEGFTYDIISKSYIENSEVQFISNNFKTKKNSNARYGFLFSNQRLLDSILIKYVNSNNQLEPVRTYSFKYVSGKFNSDLLLSVSQFDSSFYKVGEHKFDYYDDITTGGNTNYVSSNTITANNPSESSIGFSGITSIATELNKKGILNNTKTEGVGGSFYAGVGFGLKFWKTDNSLGINTSYQHTWTNGQTMLIDITGDGISDYIYADKGFLYYMPGLINGSSAIFGQAVKIEGAPESFLKTETDILSLGLAANVKLPSNTVKINGRADWDLLNKSTTKAYFSDVNGDGLVDIVYNEKVFFNYVKDEKPCFDRNSKLSANPMTNRTIYDLTPAAAGLTRYDESEDDSIKSKLSPLQDIVRVWEAPYKGMISISGTVKLLPPGQNYDTLAYSKADGVRVAIQYGHNELWHVKIVNGDNTIKNANATCQVMPGDKVFFRVQSGDSLTSNGDFDEVVWRPQIQYSYVDESVTPKALYGGYNSNTVYSATEGYIISKLGYNHIDTIAPYTIKGKFSKPITNSDIKLEVFTSNYPSEYPDTLDQNNKYVCNSGYEYKKVHTVIFSNNLAYNNTDINYVSETSNKHTYFWFRLTSTSDEKWEDIKCAPEIHYSHNSKGVYIKDTLFAGVKYDISKTVLYERSNQYQSGMQPYLYQMTYAKIRPYMWNASANYITPDYCNPVNCQLQIVSSNGYEKWYSGKYDLRITSSNNNFIDFYSGTTRYYSTFNLYVDEDTYKNNNFGIEVFDTQTNQTSHIFPKVYVKQNNYDYGPMWRGWGQFEYNAARGRYARPIEIDSLYLPKDSDNVLFDNMCLVPLSPQSKTKKFWQGYCENIRLAGDTMCSGRLIANDIKISTYISEDGPFRARRKVSNTLTTEDLTKYYIEAPNLISKSKNVSFGGNVDLTIANDIFKNLPIKVQKNLGLSIQGSYSSGSSEKILDYIDMNGDGYPDYFKEGIIHYSNSRGTKTDIKCIRQNQFEKMQSASLGVSIGIVNPTDRNVKKSSTNSVTLKAIEESATINASANVNFSSNKLIISFFDINGDGLPDMINHEDKTVSVNLGYTFSTPVSLETFQSSTTTFGANTGLGIGVELFDGDLIAGFGISNSLSTINKKLVDINGDGLVDIVSRKVGITPGSLILTNYIPRDNIYVRLNNGNGFSSDSILWSTNLALESSAATTRSVNAAGTFGFPIFGAVKLVFSLSGQYSNTVSRTLDDVRDYDGDGFADFIKTNLVSNSLEVTTSNIRRTNKLKTITNPLGGTFQVDYKRTVPTSDHPGGKLVMNNLTINDGISDDGYNSNFSFQYENGKYSRREREFDGFGNVTTIYGENQYYSEVTTNTRIFQYDSNMTIGSSSSTVQLPSQLDNLAEGTSYNVEFISETTAPVVRTLVDMSAHIFKDVTTTTKTFLRSVAYKKAILTFDTRNYYTKGNLLKMAVYDGQGKKYQESENEYYCYDVRTRRYVKGSGGSAQKIDNYNYVENNQPSDSVVVYAPLKYTKTTVYEGGTSGLLTNQTHYTYWVNYNNEKNQFGDLKTYSYSDKGTLNNDGTGTYDYQTSIWYKSDMTSKYYVAGLPTEVKVEDKNKLYRHLRAYYTHTGYPTHMTRIAQYPNATDSAVTTLKYDRAGNITNKVLPSKMAYTYTYDARYNMYLTQVKDTFGYVSKLENYNYKYGVPCKTTDINGNVMITSLDNQGRVTQIKGPNESAYTLKFEYHPQVTKDANGITAPAYAITKHYDPANPANDLETVTFVDGMGRPIQVKKDGYVDGAEKMIVSGRAKFDAFGRVKEAYYPVVEAMGTKTTFNRSFDSQTPTRTTYDILDRALTTTLPDNSVTTMSYAIESGLLKTTVTDALNHSQITYTDGSGKTVKTVQRPDSVPIVTQFAYDPISQLTTVTDVMGKQTVSVYDMAGRRTQVTHPASGITKFEYDPAGNLKAKQTANMLADNGTKKIQYYYTYNRLDSIVYPDHTENNVKYVYGTATDNTGANRKGRLVYQEDGSGGQEFKYGKMGELTEVRRTLVIPNQAVATYVTGWSYDCWNRVRTMTYPDGETVNYNYNTAGLLTGVSSTNNTYVSNITYDKFEQRTSMQYGNGAVTNYTYNPLNRRMDNLNVKVGVNYIMNNAYTYDAVSNVKSVTNTGTASNNMGGTMAHNYGYDNLYRLKSANGTFTGANGKTANYTLAMGYDNLHNITGKKQTISQNNVQFTGLLQAGYNLGYQYADNSQQIANIADSSYRVEGAAVITPVVKTQSYGYDANGNMVFVNTGTKTPDGKLQATNSRKLLWDEENRLLSVSDNGFVSNYWYDAAGERTVKESGDNEGVQVNGVLSGARTGTTNFTAYISPYLVLTNGGNYTKHIYMGSQRIVSKLSNSSLFDGENPVDADKAMINDFTKKYNKQTDCLKARYDSLGVNFNGTLYKNMTNPAVDALGGGTTMTPLKYYSHSDHLGSSSLITDASGGLVQHLEYVPFGEVFIDERPSQSSWSTPYKFNAKELDEETGLYYYGARYMDPRTSVWLSVDPLAEKYPNLSSYVYCHNNPVNMIDPDGMTDYTVDNKAYIKRCGDVNNDPDRLIALGDDNKVTKDKDGNITDKITTVNDKKLLPALEANPKVNYKGNYGTTSSEADAFNVYKFVSDNTKAEWGINGYKTKSGDQYLLRTSHDPDAVSTTDGQFNPLQKFIDIHSHWQKTDLPKASGYGGDFAAGDYLVINKKYNQFKSANKKYPEAYPKYFIYHVNSKGLYQYTPDNPSILRRKIRNYVDFYKR